MLVRVQSIDSHLAGSRLRRNSPTQLPDEMVLRFASAPLARAAPSPLMPNNAIPLAHDRPAFPSPAIRIWQAAMSRLKPTRSVSFSAGCAWVLSDLGNA